MEDKREEMLKKTFSENLRYFLDLRKKTRAELAAAVGVAVSTVSYWMNGVKIPRADKLAAICRFLHIDMSDLIGDVHPVQSFEQQLFEEEGIMLRKFGELDETDKQMVRDLVDRLTERREG